MYTDKITKNVADAVNKILVEGKSDDAKEKLEQLKREREERMDSEMKSEPEKKQSITRRIVRGKSYGGADQKDQPEDSETGSETGEQPVKRGRGRPKGSKSGARRLNNSFSYFVETYEENGLKKLFEEIQQSVIEEEPTNPEFTKEVEEAKEKDAGTSKKKAKVAEPSVQAVKNVTEQEEVESIEEKAPPGFEGTVKAMKKNKDIDNPYALAWYMKKRGFKSHKK